MSDERITDLILQRLENIERKIDGMQTSGCAKGRDPHAEARRAAAEAKAEKDALLKDIRRGSASAR